MSVTTYTPVCPIKFPLRHERTGKRRGPRYRLRPDKDGLSGAAFCTAGMVAMAMSYRESYLAELKALPTAYNREFALISLRILRWQVRNAALWARRFSHRIADNDPRFAELDTEHRAHSAALAAYSAKHFVT